MTRIGGSEQCALSTNDAINESLDVEWVTVGKMWGRKLPHCNTRLGDTQREKRRALKTSLLKTRPYTSKY